MANCTPKFICILMIINNGLNIKLSEGADPPDEETWQIHFRNAGIVPYILKKPPRFELKLKMRNRKDLDKDYKEECKEDIGKSPE